MNENATGEMVLTLASELEITLSRVLDAPRQRVFEAWTQPEHVREWWGQKDSTLAVCEIDLRPGGAWCYVERATDGNEYPFKGEYVEVRPQERLVHTFVFDIPPFNARPATVTVVFESLGDRTRVTEATVFQTTEDRDAMLESGMERGAAESFARLDALLTVLS